MKNGNEFGTLSKEVANYLDINPNTLRRWSLELEKHGYIFERNNKDQRIYYERDIQMLSELKIILDKGQSMDNATKAIAFKHKERKNAEKTLSVIINGERDNEQITLSRRNLESIIESTVEKAIEQEREAMFNAFELKMNDSIEKRDRLLMQSINRTIEKKRLEIAATQEEKKTWWSKLFSK
ncbi:MerR family transcriptional regulator [Bacillus cereus]|uniref:DNA-binding protein n=1 Tax=Bacillus cereus TaxID=1396 RepID=A0AA44Q860_BACCE|nr:MerR family transcriptional regulator [Bacillus cereus]PFM99356.1 DNA-binding protein [Bacillus cereus]PFR98766.1 DNA-binding protein [Bacillus cereus]